MKKLLILLLGLIIGQTISAQVKFRVALQPDNKTYNVFLRPDVEWSGPLGTTVTSQLSLRVPAGGFDVGNLSSTSGMWSKSVHVFGPEENPTFDYISFSLVSTTGAIPYVAGEEVMLFSFENTGTCTGDLEFISNDDDPFLPPNSASVNVGNRISVAGAGLGVNAYSGSYAEGGYTCLTNVGCGITFNGVDMISPSTCGASDGSIQIFASTDLGLDLVYSIDDGDTYHPTSLFTGLNSGDYNIWIRDIASICLEEVGSINLPGPLGPIILNQESTNPDCDVDNGTITIEARTDSGDPVEFSIDLGMTWQSSNTFTGLAEGEYYVQVRNAVNQCITQVGPFELTGCTPSTCIMYYEMELLASGRYQVVLLSDVTYPSPTNITSNLQVSIKAPTGGLVIEDFQSEVPGVNFTVGNPYVAPTEAPDQDYFTISLATLPTSDINYIMGNRLPLFSFANAGGCGAGGTIDLIENDVDPFFPPNSQSANVGQQLFVFAHGSDVPICLNANRSVPCEETPVQCLSNFEFSKLPNETYQVSMTPAVDYTGNPGRTTELNVTVKVPTGTFSVANLTGSNGLTYEATVVATSPAEDPTFDYVNITLTDIGTDQIPYVSGQKVDLFTFENGGACSGLDLKIMDPATDPFAAVNTNVGLFLKIAGAGVDRLETCLTDTTQPDCPAFSPSIDTIYVTIPTDRPSTECVTTVLDLPNGVGVATVCGNGAFVNANTNTGSDCVELTPISDFNETDLLCVVHCDATQTTVCDTTYIVVCPQVQIQPVAAGCAGSDFTITTIGGAGDFTWTPAATGQTITVSPSVTTTYTVVADDGNGCSTTDNVEVAVSPNLQPTFTFDGICLGEVTTFTSGNASLNHTWDFGDGNTSTDANPTHTYAAEGTFTVSLSVMDGNGCSGMVSNQVTISGTGGQGTTETLTACGGEDVQLNATGGTTYVWSPTTGLSDPNIANPIANVNTSTTYTVEVSGSAGCGTVNTVQLDITQAPVIIDVIGEDLTSCDVADGSIKIFANDGGNALEYSIDCGVTWSTSSDFADLDKGTYGVIVRSMVTGCTTKWPDEVIFNGIQGPIFRMVATTPPTACGANDATITIESDSTGIEYSIDGGQTWSADNSFSDLGAGTFDIQIRYTNGSCVVTYDQGPIAIVDGSAPLIADPIEKAYTCNGAPKTIQIEINEDIDTYVINTSGNYVSDMTAGGILTFEASTSLDSATYEVLITGVNGCSVTESFKLYSAFAPELMVDELTNADCGVDNGSFQLNIGGATAPFTYTISNGTGVLQQDVAVPSNNTSFDNMAGGVYTITLANETQCATTTEVTIDVNPVDFMLNQTLVMPDCNQSNGSIELMNVPANATIEWTNIFNEVISTGMNPTRLSAGVYTVKVTDANGCFQTQAIELQSVGAPDVLLGQAIAPFCAGDSSGVVSFQVNGMGNFSATIVELGIQQDFQGDILTMIQGLPAGTFDLVVSDENSCETITTINIVENGIIANLAPTQPTDCALADGELCFDLSSGTAPYSIQSSLGDRSNVMENSQICFTDIPSGTYEIKIIDANGCEKIEVVEFTAPNQPSIADDAFATDGFICPGDATGEIVTTAANEYNVYDLDNNLLGVTPISNLSEGIYLISYDENGCVAQRTVELTATVAAWEVTPAITAETCIGNDGAILLDVQGANGSYIYEWEGSSSISNIANDLSAGNTYAVSIEDAEGCEFILDNLTIDLLCDPTGNTYPDTSRLRTPFETPLANVCMLDNLPIASTVTPCSNPSNGTVDLDASGCFTYTPDDGFLGDDEFCLNICDDNGNCQEVIIIVTVFGNEVNVLSGMSPNGDFENDYLIIQNIESYPANTVKVYNRWGNLVFKREAYSNDLPWQGDFEGASLPDGTYFVKIDLGDGTTIVDYIQLMR